MRAARAGTRVTLTGVLKGCFGVSLGAVTPTSLSFFPSCSARSRCCLCSLFREQLPSGSSALDSCFWH